MSISRSTNVRHGFFILAGVAALFLTWPHAFQWMAAGGNILNLAGVHGVGRVRQQADRTGVQVGLDIRGTVVHRCIDGVPGLSRYS
jgi:hypothetical protein